MECVRRVIYNSRPSPWDLVVGYPSFFPFATYTPDRAEAPGIDCPCSALCAVTAPLIPFFVPGSVSRQNRAAPLAMADAAPRQDTDMSVSEYIRTRITSLKPPMTKVQNPIPILRMLTGKQWAFFLVALSAWVCLPSPI